MEVEIDTKGGGVKIILGMAGFKNMETALQERSGM